VASTNEIALDDLLVSVVRGRIILRSQRLQRQVVPRITSAHNYFNGSTLYRMLALLQRQDVADALIWGWGPLGRLTVLPRVRYGRAILTPRLWRILPKDIRELKALSRPAAIDDLLARRDKLQIPRFVLYGERDNLIPIDFENPLTLEVFVQSLQPNRTANLWESFEATPLAGPEGRYVNETFVFFKGPKPVVRTEARGSRVVWRPGTDWLYAKIYCAPSASDRILRENLAPMVRAALAAGNVRQWFFVRYRDQEPHLRLRFQGEPDVLRSQVLAELMTALGPVIGDDLVWRVAFESYVPEIERYGGTEGERIARHFFQFDSESVLDFLSLPEAGLERWRIALKTAHDLLSAVDPDLEVHLRETLRSRDNLSVVFNREPMLKRALGLRFRRERAALTVLLESGGLQPHFLCWLEKRRTASLEFAERLREADRRGVLTSSPIRIWSSILHMSLNRLVPAELRRYEPIIHEFLRRLYESKIAVADRTGQQPELQRGRA
jgi:thiopeptide-type bacteriocin biosynthesis protein